MQELAFIFVLPINAKENGILILYTTHYSSSIVKFSFLFIKRLTLRIQMELFRNILLEFFNFSKFPIPTPKVYPHVN